MKRLPAFILILLLAGHTPAATVYFDLADFQHTYLTARRLVMTPETNPSVSGTNIVSKDPRSQTTTASGRVTFTNVAAGTYKCELYGPTVVTPFYITLTNTSATLNAKDLISVSTNSPTGSSAYSIASADEVFVAWARMARNYLYVATNGNDATALRGRPDRPFATIAGANSVAMAGDTVGCYAGMYLATNALKNGVGYWMEPGCVWTNSNDSAAPATHDMMNDKGGATTNAIAGFGEFRYLWETNQISIASLGGIVLTNPATRLTVTGDRMLGRHFVTSGANSTPAVGIGNCAYFSLTLTEFVDPDIDRVSFDPSDPETEIFSHCSFVIWANGECDIDVKRATTESGYVLWTTGNTNTLNWKGHRMKSVRGNALYAGSASANQRTWITLTETLDGGGQAISSVNLGGGRVYLTVPKIRGGSFSPAVYLTGHEFWINSQKLAGASANDPFSGSLLEIAGGKTHIAVLEYEAEKQMVGPAVMIRGGTNIFHGGTMLVTNGPAIVFTGFGGGPSRTRLKDMNIQTFSTSGTGPTNECITIYTNAPTFQNVSLTSPSATVPCIASTNVNLHIPVDGLLSLNNGTTNSLCRFTNSGIVKLGNGITILP